MSVAQSAVATLYFIPDTLYFFVPLRVSKIAYVRIEAEYDMEHLNYAMPALPQRTHVQKQQSLEPEEGVQYAYALP